MERPLFAPVGTPVMQLDTPALVVDLDLLQHNLNTVHTRFAHYQTKLRPQVSHHRCPTLAHRQLAAGGTVGGISVSTLGEAEVFAAHGFTDIVVTNHVVTGGKIAHLCALAGQVRLTIAADQPQNIHDLAAAAASRHVTLRVALDIQTHHGQCGVAPGQPAVELARVVCQASHLEFAGLMTMHDLDHSKDLGGRTSDTRQIRQALLDTQHMIEQAGMQVPAISVDDAALSDADMRLDGITEIRAGAYALMDARSSTRLPDLRPAVRVLTTVTSRPEPGMAITDTGQKAIGVDSGLPVVSDMPGVVADRLSAEHCRLLLDSDAARHLAPGDKLWLTPWDSAACANLYDYLHVMRDGRLEAVWPIAARGHYR